MTSQRKMEKVRCIWQFLKQWILELAGLKAPEGQLSDGENVLQTMLGKTSESRQSPIFWARPPDRKTYRDFDKPLPDLAMRDSDFKLLCDFDGGRPELYNLVKNPEEPHNIADKYSEKVENMTKMVRTWYTNMPQ